MISGIPGAVQCLRYRGEVTLANTTVSGNDATLGGGGLLNDSGTLTNCTVSGNTAAYTGGGIHARGSLTLTNCTVSRNAAGGRGGGIFVVPPWEATLINTIVEGDCNDGQLTSNGYNIESPGNTCGFDQSTDQANVVEGQLNLGPLRDNGGPTETHALLHGSVAIDVIPEATCEVDDDQRGEPRPGGATCDVGAFEVQP